MKTANWIDGSWVQAAGKDHFVPEVSAGQKDKIAWPRSGLADLELALDGLEARAGAWGELSTKARRKRLEALLDGWQGDGAGVDQLAEVLGLDAGDLDHELELALECADRVLTRRGPGPGPVFVHISATQLFVGLMRAVLPALLDGAPVLILSDPDLPWVAAEFVWQFGADELVGDALALLHDDRSTCLPGALAETYFERAVLSEVPESEAPESGDLELRLQPSSNRSFAVFEDMDPVEAAEGVWRRALDPARQLSGQRDGQVGRVFCHERRFSEFVSAMLARVDREENAQGCRCFVRDLYPYLDRQSGLGLDEGATLLRGGPGEGAGFRAQRRKAILRPSVLTNAEPMMGLVRATRPAPLLSIIRARTDAEALAARDRFDDPDN
mgnify:CR=1 FL=1